MAIGTHAEELADLVKFQNETIKQYEANMSFLTNKISELLDAIRHLERRIKFEKVTNTCAKCDLERK